MRICELIKDVIGENSTNKKKPMICMFPCYCTGQIKVQDKNKHKKKLSFHQRNNNILNVAITLK